MTFHIYRGRYDGNAQEHIDLITTLKSLIARPVIPASGFATNFMLNLIAYNLIRIPMRRAAGAQATKAAPNSRTHHPNNGPAKKDKVQFPGFSANC